MVLPQELRGELVSVPGEVVLRRTPDGVLMSPVPTEGTVGTADDGLPVLALGRPVTNEEVLAAVDLERAGR